MRGAAVQYGDDLHRLPDFCLPVPVNELLTMFMGPLVALMMLAATATQGGDRGAIYRPATKIASASVTIISAERISDHPRDKQPERRDRQVRTRDDRPLIEFF